MLDLADRSETGAARRGGQDARDLVEREQGPQTTA